MSEEVKDLDIEFIDSISIEQVRHILKLFKETVNPLLIAQLLNIKELGFVKYDAIDGIIPRYEPIEENGKVKGIRLGYIIIHGHPYEVVVWKDRIELFSSLTGVVIKFY